MSQKVKAQVYDLLVDVAKEESEVRKIEADARAYIEDARKRALPYQQKIEKLRARINELTGEIK